MSDDHEERPYSPDSPVYDASPNYGESDGEDRGIRSPPPEEQGSSAVVHSNPTSPTGSDGEVEDDNAPHSPDPELYNSPVYDTSPKYDDDKAASPVAAENEGSAPVEEQEDEAEEHNEGPTSPNNSPQGDGEEAVQRTRSGSNEDHESGEEDESPRKKRKALIDSDDEDAEKDEEAEEGEKSSPTKRRVLVSDDEDSDGDEESKPLKKKLLGSDDDDDDDDGEKREGEVGELMTNIFGDDSDEEDEKGEEGKEDDEEVKGEVDDDDEGEGNRRERDDNGMEWDFDVMLREKKAEKTKKKRRRKDGGIDIINDDDGTVAYMVEAMKAAAKEDRHSNMERKPALKKRKMLNEVKAVLMKAGMVEAMMDGGMMSAISEWLAPLPDKSLPALEIRTALLKIMQGYGRIDQGVLKQSGLGKAVMLLYKHPREVKTNKEMAAKLIREWARPIFQLETDFGSFTREERVQRDYDHMPAAKKQRRLSSDSAGPSSSQMGPGEKKDTGPRPGEKGHIMRARVPKPSTKDYVVRPKGPVAFEGEIRDRKGKAFNRLDKTQRDFLERTKKSKAQRAIGVSLEGRNLAL